MSKPLPEEPRSPRTPPRREYLAARRRTGRGSSCSRSSSKETRRCPRRCASSSIVFKCLTGRLPFESEALGDLLLKIIVEPLPIPSQYFSAISAGFDGWWLEAAARNPDDHRRELAIAHWLNGDAAEGMRVAAELWQEAPDLKRNAVVLAGFDIREYHPYRDSTTGEERG